MGGTYVFPGGGLEPSDSGADAASVLGGDPELLPWRAAAVRELAEEAGIWLTDDDVPPNAAEAEDPWQILSRNAVSIDAESLVYFSNWVTPPQLTIRFDARFFAAKAPARSVAVADESEVFDATWISPRTALDRHDAREWEVPIPTRAQLELFANHERVESVLHHLHALESVPRIEPNIGIDPAGATTVLLPGDVGVPLDRTIEGSGH